MYTNCTLAMGNSSALVSSEKRQDQAHGVRYVRSLLGRSNFGKESRGYGIPSSPLSMPKICAL